MKTSVGPGISLNVISFHEELTIRIRQIQPNSSCFERNQQHHWGPRRSLELRNGLMPFLDVHRAVEACKRNGLPLQRALYEVQETCKLREHHSSETWVLVPYAAYEG